MAYGEKYFVTHKTDIAGTTVTYRIEIHEDGFGGSATEKRAAGSIFKFGYDQADVKKIWDNPVQKGYLELELFIQNATNLGILTDIFAGDEDDYKLVLKVDGSTKWSGFVIPDLIEYSEGQYPFTATITAKDLHLLESDDYDTNTATSYKLYATAIADIVNATGLNLGLHTYNEWTAGSISGTDDYFNQVYIDEYQAQNFSSITNGSFEPLSKMEVLKHIIPSGFILRQWNNVWNLVDLSHLAQNPSTATRYEYNASGAKTGKTDPVDLTQTVDRSSSFVLGTSVNKPFPAIKRLEMEYNHKTSIQNLIFESLYTVSVDGQFESETLSVSDTTGRYIEVSGSVEVDTDTNPGSLRTGDAEILIQIDDYELSLSDGSILTSNGVQDVSVSGSTDTLTGSFSRRSAGTIPADVDASELLVQMRWATVSGETVQEVRWENMQAKIIYSDAVADSASITYRLTQPGNYSYRSTMDKIIYGQGPDSESHSALRYFSGGGNYLQLSSFSHVGGTSYDYHEFLMSNVMNMQRGHTNSIQVDLLASFAPLNVIQYRSTNYFFLDGDLSGRNTQWNGNMVELAWGTDSDTLEDFIDIDTATDEGLGIVDSALNGATIKTKRFAENQKITVTTSDLTGTVTSIPIESVGSRFIEVGAVFYLFNIDNGKLTEFTLAQPQLPSATSLTVESKNLGVETIPSGSWVIFNGEKISSYLTRGDTFIRLGVRDSEQATTEDGDAYQTEDGDEWHFATEEDQTALNHHTSSEIALLQGQIVLKATAGGRIAAVNLDARPETGSEITIQADQINLQGLVTAINDGGSETEIDGGKIKADTSVTVGTGNNVAVLSGVNETYRIWAGNADASIAPFRVQQDGTVVATNVVTLEGDGTGEINNLNLVNLSLTGTLTVDTGAVSVEDTRTISGSSVDLSTTLKDGELKLVMNASGADQSKVLVTASDSANLDAIISVESLTGTKLKTEINTFGVNMYDVDDRTNTELEFVAPDSSDPAFMSIGSYGVDNPGVTASGNYLKVVVNGVANYIPLYN